MTGVTTTRNRAPGPPGDRGGRPSATSPHALAAAAQRLFIEYGFEAVSVEDVAAAVGVSRRTFFRYFATKADVLWVESPAELGRLRAALADVAPEIAYQEAVTEAVVSVFDHPAHDIEWARHRAQLVLSVPAVQAHASLVYAEWRAVVGGFAARWSGQPAGALFPVTVGHAVMAGVLAAHEFWIGHPDSSLPQSLRATLALALPPSTG